MVFGPKTDKYVLIWGVGPEINKYDNYFDAGGVISEFVILFNAGKVVTLTLSVFIMAGFSLSCSNNPLRS